MKIKKIRKKISVIFGAALILLNFIPNNSIAKCPTRMGSVFPQESFLVIAHRGSTIKFPENTIPAFKEALNALQEQDNKDRHSGSAMRVMNTTGYP